MTITGGCLCGAMCYESHGAPINMRVCHCRSCQKATGGPFFARILVALKDVRITGPVAWFHSSPELRRGFCSVCGTALFSERAGRSVIGLSAGSLDDPALFRPEEHIWVASRQAWLDSEGDLPHHEGAAPS